MNKYFIYDGTISGWMYLFRFILQMILIPLNKSFSFINNLKELNEVNAILKENKLEKEILKVIKNN